MRIKFLRAGCSGATPAVACVLLLAAVAWAQQVTTDHDSRADYSRYHTYSWLKVNTPNTIWDHRVQDAIDGQLTSHGLRKVPSGGDLGVSAIGIAKDKTELRTYYNDMPRWRWGGFGEATTTPETYRVGSLVVDLFDGSSKQLVWRATAQDTLSDQPEKNQKKLQKAVDKMFRKFPPKPDK